MKKILGILCMAVLLLCTGTQAFAASKPTITVSKVTAEAGKSISIPITVSGNTGICGAELTVSYDKALILTGVSNGTGFASLTLTKPGNLNANPVNLLWDGTEADYSNGTIATLTFKAPSANGVYNIAISYLDGEIVDGDIQPVAVNVVNGSITVEGKDKVTNVFSDVVQGEWYVNAVQYVYDNGIMSGSNGSFRPTGNITRAQVVATLYNLEGKPAVKDYSGVKDLVDVEAGQWYTDAVCWAYNVGVASGNKTTGMFNTDTPVTRQQLATFFYNYAKYKGLDTKTRADISSMVGADEVASYALDTMQWAVGTGLITGSATNVNGVTVYNLKPTGTATRAQAAAILQRFCENNHL